MDETEQRKKFCDDKRLEVTYNDEGKIIALKGYCKAKDFKKHKL